MSKDVPFRLRLAVAMVAAAVLSVFAVPLALAQSPDDIPGFDQLPLPGGEDPAEDPSEDPTEDPAEDDDDDAPQVDAPGGGVDTGAGGLATDSGPVTLAAAGALAVTGAAALVARRRTARP